MVEKKSKSSCKELYTSYLYNGRPVHICMDGTGDDAVINVDLQDYILRFNKWEFSDLVAILLDVDIIANGDNQKYIEEAKESLKTRSLDVEKTLEEREEENDEFEDGEDENPKEFLN